MRRRQFLEFLSALPAGGTVLESHAIALAQEGKKLSRETLLQLETLSGVRFTDRQRDMVLASLEGFLRSIQRIRDMKIPPEVAPALYFIPQTRGAWKVRR